MRRANSGVTLVELMIAVAIVGILVAIAYPSYQQYVLRGARMDAKAELMEASQELEKCFTRFGRYLPAAVGDCVAYDGIIAGTRRSEQRKYLISFNGGVTATTYQLQAVPQGGQTQDTLCGTLTMNQAGARGQTGTGGTTAQCW